MNHVAHLKLALTDWLLVKDFWAAPAGFGCHTNLAPMGFHDTPIVEARLTSVTWRCTKGTRGSVPPMRMPPYKPTGQAGLDVFQAILGFDMVWSLHWAVASRTSQCQAPFDQKTEAGENPDVSFLGSGWLDMICLGMEGLKFGSYFHFHRIPTFNKCLFFKQSPATGDLVSHRFLDSAWQALYPRIPSRKEYIMIWYDMIWYDMIWYDMIWYIYICIYDPVFCPQGHPPPPRMGWAPFLRSSPVFARFLQRFWLPASHLLGIWYPLDDLRSTHTPSKYLRAIYSYIYMCYVSTSYMYIYIYLHVLDLNIYI